ncbi:hypothetical protein [Methanoregula sp.]|uniref:hypothetical protein n=1 Tax=Methanoregula sp. TaxID=2052170 RepID=UPI003C76720C
MVKNIKKRWPPNGRLLSKGMAGLRRIHGFFNARDPAVPAAETAILQSKRFQRMFMRIVYPLRFSYENL